MQASGRVVRRAFGSGTKSGHAAIVLDTGEKQYVLRRQGGNAFKDPQLEKLVGKSICCSGRVYGYVLLISQWDEVSLVHG
jgi:hypothetical protein